MSERVAISVLMPVYNAQRYVAGAVESILGQTFGDFELQIIDDGSTDGSLKILKEYAARDSRIRLVSRPNTGYVAALNEMLSSARGEFIARMDADDLSLPERFEKQVGKLRKFPEVGVLGGQIEIIGPTGKVLAARSAPQEHAAIDGNHVSGRGSLISHPAAMMRTELMRSVGGYRPDFWPSEDLDLFLRLGERTQLANLPEVILRYRLHEASTSHGNRRVQREAGRRAVMEARERRGLPPINTDKKREAVNWYTNWKIYRVWAWSELAGGNLHEARKYAWSAFWRRPFSYPSWKLLYCATKGKE